MKNWFSNIGGSFGKNDKAAGNNDEQLTQSSPEVAETDKTTKKPRKWLLIGKKKPWSLKKKIIVSIISVLSAVIIVVAVFAFSILADPLGQFKTVVEQMTPLPTDTVAQSQQPTGSFVPTPSPTLDPYSKLVAQSDFSILKDTVNILLIGVDDSPERNTEAWVDKNGKTDFHSDVMIIVAINTRTNDVNLISLPRDTYAKIPDIEGVYKLNASINCGGGWPTDSGLQEVCKAASWMIAGIPVQYYYAVDMSAVKGLVDSIQGVDFNVDIAYKMQGRSYIAGMQHMDGQAVLDYLRVRKASNIEDPSGETGDLNRINRQKSMLVAIFQKLKDSGIIFKLPDILGAFNGNLKTNVPLANTAGLAAYAVNISSDKIKMYSMDGKYSYLLFKYNFVITDEAKREQIIKDVYGIDIKTNPQFAPYASEYKNYDLGSALSLWERMQKQVIGVRARGVLDNVKSILDADALLPPYPTPAPPPEPAPTEAAPTDSSPPEPTPTPTPTPDPTPSPPPVSSEGYRKYGSDIWDIYNRAESEYTQLDSWSTSGASKTTDTAFKALVAQLESDCQTFCSMFSIKVPNWTVYYESNPNQSLVKNQVPVDFR